MCGFFGCRTVIQREFGRPQWEEVLEQLEQWSAGVSTLLQSVQSVKQAAEAGDAIPAPVSSIQ